MINSRRATIAGRKVLFYMIFALVAAATAFILVYVTTTDASEIDNMPLGLEEYILINRFLHSPECFAYKDESIDRIYSFIDWSKFTDASLRHCYNLNSTIVKGFELTLTIQNEKNEKEEKTISTANWEGMLRKKTETKIMVLKEGKIYRGVLVISIQNEASLEPTNPFQKGSSGGGGAGGST